VLRSIQTVRPGDTVNLQLMDGSLDLLVQRLHPSAADPP
jgi:hypothetical protein